MSLQEIADRMALADLVMRYCRGIDRRDFALVRSLYHDDAIDDHGQMFCGDPDDYVAWLADFMPRWDATVHAIHNSLFVIDGDHAEGEHIVTAYHRTLPPARKEIIIGGRYLDRYQKRGGQWKFAHRSLVFDHGEMRDVDEPGFAALGADAAHGTADRTDPSWQLQLLAGLNA